MHIVSIALPIVDIARQKFCRGLKTSLWILIEERFDEADYRLRHSLELFER